VKTWQWLAVGAGGVGLFLLTTDKGQEIRTAAKDTVLGGGTEVVPTADLLTAAGVPSSITPDDLVPVAEYATLNSPLRWAMFIAQVGAESNFQPVAESLNYSAEALVKTWPTRFPTLADAQVVARNEQAIAARVYDGRMGNGEGEGFLFRGRGFIQLTGKDNYRAAGNSLGLDLVSDPDIVLQPAVAALTAAWFWKKKMLNGPADRGDIERATYLINGGQTHIEERTRRYNRALVALTGDSLAVS
jgi:putative chitinase